MDLKIDKLIQMMTFLHPVKSFEENFLIVYSSVDKSVDSIASMKILDDVYEIDQLLVMMVLILSNDYIDVAKHVMIELKPNRHLVLGYESVQQRIVDHFQSEKCLDSIQSLVKQTTNHIGENLNLPMT